MILLVIMGLVLVFPSLPALLLFGRSCLLLRALLPIFVLFSDLSKILTSADQHSAQTTHFLEKEDTLPPTASSLHSRRQKNTAVYIQTDERKCLYTVRKNVQNLYLQGYNGLSLGQYPQGYTRCTLSHGYVSVPLQYVPFKGKYVPLLTKLYLIVLWYHNVPLKKVQICPFKGTAPVTSLLYLWIGKFVLHTAH